MTSPRFASQGSSHAATLAHEITQATQTGAPLSEALLAAADGAHDWRTRWALRQLAERVARGEPLAQILENNSPLPAHLSGLLRASLATGEPSLAIAEWLFARERAHAHWKNVLATLTYPLATLAGAYGLFVFLSMFLMTDLAKMLVEFNINLPEHVQAIYLFTQHGAPMSLWLLGGLAAVLLLVRVIGGRSVWSQFMTALPLLGPLWHWSGSSELYRVLAILLDRQIPLPQALQLAGTGISDAALGKHCLHLAARVEQGSELARAMQSRPELPASTFPLIRSGERTGTLVTSLNTAAELLESRLQAQASIILQLAPVVIFLLVIGIYAMLVTGYVVPMFLLIRGLT